MRKCFISLKKDLTYKYHLVERCGRTGFVKKKLNTYLFHNYTARKREVCACNGK